MLRLRSSGARARDWFCMRGRLVEERAIVILAGAADDRPPAYPKDITTRPNPPQGVALNGYPKTNGPDRAGPLSQIRPAKPLFFFLGLLLGRGEPFQSLEQLLFGHAVDRNLGIVGVDRPAGRRDQ